MRHALSPGTTPWFVIQLSQNVGICISGQLLQTQTPSNFQWLTFFVFLFVCFGLSYVRAVSLLGSVGLGSTCFWNPGLKLKSKHRLGKLILLVKDRSTRRELNHRNAWKLCWDMSYVLFAYSTLTKASQMATSRKHGVEKYFHLLRAGQVQTGNK